MGTYGTGRPSNVSDMLAGINGSPMFLGVLTSPTVGVNNTTTAVPFNNSPVPQPQGAQGGTPLLNGTLAGKVLLLQPAAAGYVLPGTSATVTIATQAGTPSPAALPGVGLSANERVIIAMLPTEGWLQWIAATGTASLLVWELR